MSLIVSFFRSCCRRNNPENNPPYSRYKNPNSQLQNLFSAAKSQGRVIDLTEQDAKDTPRQYTNEGFKNSSHNLEELFSAAETGNIEILESYKNENLNILDKNGVCPSSKRLNNILQNLYAPSIALFGHTALMRAAAAGQLKAVKFLVSNGANINTKTQHPMGFKYNALDLAIAGKYNALISYLEQQGGIASYYAEENP